MRSLTLTPQHLSLNTATLGPGASLHDAVQGCVKYGFGGIAPWRDKVAEIGLSQASRLIRDAGLQVSGLCRGGMFPAASRTEREKIRADNLRAIDEAAALDAACLVLVVGGLPAGSRDLDNARQQVEDGIADMLEHARMANVRLAIEPLHPMYAGDRACINTLAQALSLCERLGADVGIAADVYHIWWDPDIVTQLQRAANRQRLLAFHLSDWLVPTRHLLTDRGMPGDGVINLSHLCQTIADTGYQGLYEVEIFSAENWWRQPVDTTLSTLVTRLEHLNNTGDRHED
ncbi:sugar phosphate isomerase/epimerase family protein [Escherichia albertii]|uniref:Sugar phosphate isomerase/epimerase n=1 Tax=Escherichia coli TaxID=562 RepID=A0A765T9S5_ECOLX|nr:sugar phosphate isomerase/epimerase family protein [Escherichia albertii]EEU9598309.1 sugar phosphate isomerase/epimerase [Escherichia albertii]EEW0764258.1 sugar phosphate isomerase/epimerase [Escherichia albertii]EFF0801584.1 sugar phosphate isomerase/epimerase [Escherichia albertii]EGM7732783.1 sugar phosphate isomerase/epimerase [Escherichia albertii]EHW5674243.1 sugar phosphate isomerase/epimerase [Escherichia albertii]